MKKIINKDYECQTKATHKRNDYAKWAFNSNFFSIFRKNKHNMQQGSVGFLIRLLLPGRSTLKLRRFISKSVNSIESMVSWFFLEQISEKMEMTYHPITEGGPSTNKNGTTQNSHHIRQYLASYMRCTLEIPTTHSTIWSLNVRANKHRAMYTLH